MGGLAATVRADLVNAAGVEAFAFAAIGGGFAGLPGLGVVVGSAGGDGLVEGAEVTDESTGGVGAASEAMEEGALFAGGGAFGGETGAVGSVEEIASEAHEDAAGVGAALIIGGAGHASGIGRWHFAGAFDANHVEVGTVVVFLAGAASTFVDVAMGGGGIGALVGGGAGGRDTATAFAEEARFAAFFAEASDTLVGLFDAEGEIPLAAPLTGTGVAGGVGHIGIDSGRAAVITTGNGAEGQQSKQSQGHASYISQFAPPSHRLPPVHATRVRSLGREVALRAPLGLGEHLTEPLLGLQRPHFPHRNPVSPGYFAPPDVPVHRESLSLALRGPNPLPPTYL